MHLKTTLRNRGESWDTLSREALKLKSGQAKSNNITVDHK